MRHKGTIEIYKKLGACDINKNKGILLKTNLMVFVQLEYKWLPRHQLGKSFHQNSKLNIIIIIIMIRKQIKYSANVPLFSFTFSRSSYGLSGQAWSQ